MLDQGSACVYAFVKSYISQAHCSLLTNKIHCELNVMPEFKRVLAEISMMSVLFLRSFPNNDITNTTSSACLQYQYLYLSPPSQSSTKQNRSNTGKNNMWPPTCPAGCRLTFSSNNLKPSLRVWFCRGALAQEAALRFGWTLDFDYFIKNLHFFVFSL